MVKKLELRIDVDKKWFEANKDKFAKAYDSQDYSEDKGKYYLIDLDLDNNEMLIGNDDTIKISAGDDNLYVYFEDKPAIEELLNLAQIISKYYNKAKTAIEALK